jgi:hypothetical protein
MKKIELILILFISQETFSQSKSSVLMKNGNLFIADAINTMMHDSPVHRSMPFGLCL